MRLFKKKQAYTQAEYLIWRSTGLFGDFRFRTLINILLYSEDNLWAKLTMQDTKDILTRYKDHCRHWNICKDTIRTELHAYTVITGIPKLEELFDNLP